MTYFSQSSVYLVIYGSDFSISELSDKISLNPTDSGVKGDRSNSGAVLKECFWKYQMPKTNALEELEKSIEDFMRIFENKISLMNTYILEKGLRIKIYIVIDAKNNEDTGVVLSQDFIKFLNRLNATVEVDIYNTASIN